MRVITDLAGDGRLPVAAIALGTFDGVHAGHQRIIHRAASLARQAAGKSLVFTSCGHPLAMLDPRQCPPMIVTRQRKVELIRTLGVDYLCMVHFTPGFLRLRPEEFIDLLCSRFVPRYIVVGPNYTFGYKGAGTVEMLRGLAGRYGFSVDVPEAVCDNHGVMVSSTVIRNLIAAGAVAGAARMLSRPVSLCGYVSIHENNRLTPDNTKIRLEVTVESGLVVPADGVYHISLLADNKRFGGWAKLTASAPACGQRRLILLFLDGNKPWKTIRHGRVEIEFAEEANAGFLAAQV